MEAHLREKHADIAYKCQDGHELKLFNLHAHTIYIHELREHGGRTSKSVITSKIKDIKRRNNIPEDFSDSEDETE